MKTGLAALVHPRAVTEFFECYQHGNPFVVHKQGGHVKALNELPLLASLEALLGAWPASVQVHLPDVRDEVSSIEATTKDARKLFDAGMGLLFNEAQLVSPVLNEWLCEIRRNLGVSALTFGRCLIYATPHGKGTAPHFDHNINFVLQLRGTKVWTLAANHHVLHPMSRHTMGLAPDPELSSYLDAPLPEQMPSDAVSYTLSPGSLLYVPRGYWHSTVAQGDALALNFTFTAPTWIDLFTAALRSRLALSYEWRQTADGVGDGNPRDAAAQQFDHLLGALVEDLPHWRAKNILDATEAVSETALEDL